MLVLVTYDVAITSGDGPRRLRRVARACKDFGQRVQFSVFEIEVDPAQWTALKARLEAIMWRPTACASITSAPTGGSGWSMSAPSPRRTSAGR